MRRQTSVVCAMRAIRSTGMIDSGVRCVVSVLDSAVWFVCININSDVSRASHRGIVFVWLYVLE